MALELPEKILVVSFSCCWLVVISLQDDVTVNTHIFFAFISEDR